MEEGNLGENKLTNMWLTRWEYALTWWPCTYKCIWPWELNLYIESQRWGHIEPCGGEEKRTRPWWHLHQHFVLQITGHFHVSHGCLAIFSYSPAPCTLSRCAGMQLLFNKWRSSFIHRSSLDSTDCEAIRFSRFYDSLLDVLSCRCTPPQSISQVVLDSLQLQADPLVPKQLDSSSDGAGVEIWCRTAECDAGTGAPSNSTSIYVHHLRSMVAMCYWDSKRNKQDQVDSWSWLTLAPGLPSGLPAEVT